MSLLTDYIERYALISMEKQERFSKLIGEHFWELDLDTGKARFNELEFPFQVLGTESENTLTFLWAWADEQTEIPPGLIRSAIELREWGREKGLPEFYTPEIDLNRADGNMIAMVSSIAARASCYYRGGYDGGAAYFLVFGDAIDAQPGLGFVSFIRRFTDIIAIYELNHRRLFLSYFREKRLPVVEQGALIGAELTTGEAVAAEFDEQDRIIAINGSLVEHAS